MPGAAAEVFGNGNGARVDRGAPAGLWPLRGRIPLGVAARARARRFRETGAALRQIRLRQIRKKGCAIFGRNALNFSGASVADRQMQSSPGSAMGV